MLSIAGFDLATPATPKYFQGLSKGKEMEKKKLVGCSSNPLSVAKELMKSPDNWQEITSKEQYL